MTVMEARRTQSIPDHEVVIGNPAQQWKIIGNGVDRKVSFAIGLQIAKAWKKTCADLNAAQPISTSNVTGLNVPIYDSSSETTQESGTVLGKRSSKSGTTLTRATSLSESEAVSTVVRSKRKLSPTGDEEEEDDDDDEPVIVVKHRSLKETIISEACKRPRLSLEADRLQTQGEHKTPVYRGMQVVDLTGD